MAGESDADAEDGEDDNSEDDDNQSFASVDDLDGTSSEYVNISESL